MTNTWEPNHDVLGVKENRIPSTNTTISSFHYGVNSIGKRTGVQTTGTAFNSTPADWVWGYDALGQVISADSPNSTFDRAYEYDQIGNRKKSADGTLETTGTSALVYEPNPLNQYDAIGAFAPTYDADGNQKDAQILPLGASSLVSCVYHWDAENRLVAVKDTNGAEIVNYLYDSQSRRVARVQGSSVTLYLYDGSNCLAEYTLHISSFILQTSFSWGLDLSGSLQGAGGVGGLLAITQHQEQSATHYFPTYDGNGNVSEYLTASGSIAARYEYDPFGRTIVATGDSAADFAYRFSTKPVDVATGLYYYGYRWYEAGTGRWVNHDPIEEFGGFNLYAYLAGGILDGVEYLGLHERIRPTWLHDNVPVEVTGFTVRRKVQRTKIIRNVEYREKLNCCIIREKHQRVTELESAYTEIVYFNPPMDLPDAVRKKGEEEMLKALEKPLLKNPKVKTAKELLSLAIQLKKMTDVPTASLNKDSIIISHAESVTYEMIGPPKDLDRDLAPIVVPNVTREQCEILGKDIYGNNITYLD